MFFTHAKHAMAAQIAVMCKMILIIHSLYKNNQKLIMSFIKYWKKKTNNKKLSFENKDIPF